MALHTFPKANCYDNICMYLLPSHVILQYNSGELIGELWSDAHRNELLYLDAIIESTHDELESTVVKDAQSGELIGRANLIVPLEMPWSGELVLDPSF